MNFFYVLLLFLPFFVCCKTKKLLSPPAIEVYKINEDIPDQGKTTGKDYIHGIVLNTTSDTIQNAAILLKINDSICINTMTDFEGYFGVYYDQSKINDLSYFEVVKEGQAKRSVPFHIFIKDSTIVIDKIGKILSYDDYLSFSAKIRKCSW
ncbi:hypothetical protein ACSTS3_11415 [Aquimarina muelleri]|uniref:hypothetical protein n=1 Tax=Aquimarina muelleri TaxID=279356 RepID=UPI003F682AF5